MKPYGLGNKVRFPHKMDCHPPKGWINWWEDIRSFVSRRTMKQKIEKEIESEMYFKECCRSCVHNLTGLFPCAMIDKQEVKDYLNSDTDECCPEWYDEC